MLPFLSLPALRVRIFAAFTGGGGGGKRRTERGGRQRNPRPLRPLTGSRRGPPGRGGNRRARPRPRPTNGRGYRTAVAPPTPGVMASLKACQPTAGLALGADVMTYEPGVAGKAAHAPSVPQDGGGHQQRDGVRRGGGGREARPPRHPRGGLRGERGGAGGDRRDLRSGGRDRPP